MKVKQSKELDPIAVSVQDTARMLGINDTRTVYKLIHNKDIKARKIGRLWRVSVKSLNEYMRANGE